MEEWRPIPGYEGFYEVSNIGRIRRNGRVKKLERGAFGYLRIMLSRHGIKRRFMVHRLVMLAFDGPCPDKMQVNHKNGKKTDNQVSNLEYLTASANQKHSYDVLGKIRLVGSMGPGSKLTEGQVIEIRVIGYSQRLQATADKFGVSKSSISLILRRHIWKHIP